jgi:hypothetical protein
LMTNGGTVLAKVDSAGELTASQLKSTGDIKIQSGSSLFESANTGPYLNFSSSALTVNHRGVTSTTSFIVKGMASQTANLQEWQNSAGFINARVASNGGVFAPSFAAGSGGFVSTDNVVDRAFSGPFLVMGSTNATMQTRAATNVGLIVKGAASQTANLMEFKDSASTNVLTISPVGAIRSASRLSIGNIGIDFGVFSLQVGSPVTIAAVIRGAASQTADLTQWQNSSGTVLAEVTATGGFELNGKDIELMTVMGAL